MNDPGNNCESQPNDVSVPQRINLSSGDNQQQYPQYQENESTIRGSDNHYLVFSGSHEIKISNLDGGGAQNEFQISQQNQNPSSSIKISSSDRNKLGSREIQDQGITPPNGIFGATHAPIIKSHSLFSKEGISKDFSVSQGDFRMDQLDSFSMSGQSMMLNEHLVAGGNRKSSNNNRTISNQTPLSENRHELGLGKGDLHSESKLLTSESVSKSQKNSDSQASYEDSSSSLSAFKLTMMGRYEELKQMCFEQKMSYLKIENEQGNSLIIKAVQNKDLNGIKVLVEEAKNQLLSQGYSEAHVEIEIVEWINKPSKSGYTAAHFGCYVGDSEILLLLHSLGADFLARSNEGSSGLHIAAQNDSISSIIFLLLLGVDINLVDFKQATALHWASFQGLDQSVSYLLAFGALVNEKDADGMTPLILGAISGSIKITKMLLMAGADKSIEDNKNRTALYLVDQDSDSSNPDIAEMLKRTSGFQEYWNIRPVFKLTRKNSVQIRYFLFLYSISQVSFLFFSYSLWDESEKFGIIATMCGLTLVTLTFFFNAWLRNPGYLSKKQNHWRKMNKNHDEISIEEMTKVQEVIESHSQGIKRSSLSVKESKSRFEGLNSLDREGLLSLFCLLREEKDPSKVCAHCCIIKPKRSRHCDICQQCVSVYDHHCPWINNCVGTRNHGYFLGFIISIWLSILLFIGLNAVYSWRDYSFENIQQSLDPFGLVSQDKLTEFLIAKWVVLGISIFFCFLFGVPLSLLVIVQLQNFKSNQTTFERFSLSAQAKAQSESGFVSSVITQNNTPNQIEATELRQSLFESNTSSASTYIRKRDNCLQMCYKNQQNPAFFMRQKLQSKSRYLTEQETQINP